MGKKTKKGGPGGPAGSSPPTNTGSKRTRDAEEKTGLTPEEKVTKTKKYPSKYKSCTNTSDISDSGETPTDSDLKQNDSIMEANDDLGASASRVDQHSVNAQTSGVATVASASVKVTPNQRAETETQEPEQMESQTIQNVSSTNYRDSSNIVTESEDEDLLPLTQAEEEQLRRKSDPTVEKDEPAAKKAKSFSEAAKSKRAYEILYLHKGDKERKAIDRDMFYKIMDKYQGRALNKVLEGQNFPDNILWHSWSEGRGLVATGDKETSEYFIKEISALKMGKAVYRAWHRDQVSEGKLVSVWLAGSSYANFGPARILEALMKQNGLAGQSTGVKYTKVTKEGRVLIFFADKTLWDGLLARSTSATGGRAALKLGSFQVVAQLSRNVPTVEGLSLGEPTAAGTSTGAKAGCSKD